MEFGILPEIQNIGFYCGDPKIAHKFTGDTINIKVLLSVTLILPLILICGVEWGCHGAQGYAKRGSSRWAWLLQSLLWYREYLSGLLIVFFLTDVAKVLVGEPRPHFLDTCKPFQAFNCSSGYIPNYTCSNNELSMWRVRDASKSFPSGHAAISIYLFTFSAWFLQKRMCGVSVLIVAWLQVICLAWALACSLTRITDHRHHWWDVLAGSILGFIVGIYTVDHFCCCFRVGSYKNLTASGIKTGSLNDLKANGTLYHDTASARRLLTSTSSYSAEQHIQGMNDVTLT